MADAINEAIRDVLYARLGTLALSPVHLIAWRNVNFTKPASNRYLEVRFVPNDNSRFGVDGGPHDRFGFLQINVRDALNTGSRVEVTAGRVAAHFPADLPLYGDLGVKVRITKDTDPGDMIIETSPPGVMVPVLIPYECLI